MNIKCKIKSTGEVFCPFRFAFDGDGNVLYIWRNLHMNSFVMAKDVEFIVEDAK